MAADWRHRPLQRSSKSSLVSSAFIALRPGRWSENVASQRVLEKCHFTRIGVASRYLRIAGEWRDHVLFQRTAEN